MRTLLESPIILIILIWVISAFFKKSKGSVQQGDRKGQQNQRWSPPSPFEPRRNQNTVNNKPNYPKPHGQRQVMNQYKQTTLDTSKYKDATGEKRMRDNSDNKRTTSFRPSLEVLSPGEQTPASYQIPVDQKRLVDGLIWSEVLGPPRAKRPHRSISKQ